MIIEIYQKIQSKVDKARKIKGSPLSLSEKILYSHLWNNELEKPYKKSVRMAVKKSL